MPPMTQNPEFSTKAFLRAPLVLVLLLLLLLLLLLVVLLSVPLGRVPLSTIVFVPFTFPIWTKLLFSLDGLPLPIIESRYVVLSFLSQPHALYI